MHVVVTPVVCNRVQVQNKTKDTHLKRATETISRNKAQIDDFAAQLKVRCGGCLLAAVTPHDVCFYFVLIYMID